MNAFYFIAPTFGDRLIHSAFVIVVAHVTFITSGIKTRLVIISYSLKKFVETSRLNSNRKCIQEISRVFN